LTSGLGVVSSLSPAKLNWPAKAHGLTFTAHIHSSCGQNLSFGHYNSSCRHHSYFPYLDRFCFFHRCTFNGNRLLVRILRV
jgi:hypothetical protein